MNYEAHDQQSFASEQADGGRRPALSRRNMALGVGGCAALVALWFATHHAAAPTLDDASAQAPSITVIVPGTTTVAGTISATGSLAARHEMPVGSVGEGGEVRRVLVNAGDWVKRGQLLASIDRQVQAEQYANQNANIAVAAADARLAQANLERAQKLVGRGFISAADIDRLTATRDAANARVSVARAQLGETAARIRRLDIVAPDDGLVLERAVEPGQVVGASSGVLFRIAQKGEMELRARLSESDLTQLSLGQSAAVTPVGSDKPVVGRIWQLSPAVDMTSRQGMARITLPYTRDIRPGGFATVDIQSGSVVAPLLPESVLQADSHGSYVYVVGANNKIERRGVRVGLVTDKGVAITSGLSGHERVVLRAGAFLSTGETVNPRLGAAGQ